MSILFPIKTTPILLDGFPLKLNEESIVAFLIKEKEPLNCTRLIEKFSPTAKVNSLDFSQIWLSHCKPSNRVKDIIEQTPSIEKNWTIIQLLALDKIQNKKINTLNQFQRRNLFIAQKLLDHTHPDILLFYRPSLAFSSLCSFYQLLFNLKQFLPIPIFLVDSFCSIVDVASQAFVLEGKREKVKFIPIPLYSFSE